jgi:uncharacterized protein YodC (DUF2158 family)
MANGREYDKPAVYQIRVKGVLERKWSDWFDGFAITQEAGDETTLVGPVADQPALYGLLTKIMNLGLPLISVLRLEDQGDESRRRIAATGHRD